MSEERSIQGGRKLAPWIALAVTLLLVGVAVFAYVSPETFERIPGASGSAGGETDSSVAVTRGSSCKSLATARRAFEKGSDEQFVSSVRAAERAAVHALDTDFVSFGRPEEIALRLGAEEMTTKVGVKARERISARLELANAACQKLQS